MFNKWLVELREQGTEKNTANWKGGQLQQGGENCTASRRLPLTNIYKKKAPH